MRSAGESDAHAQSLARTASGEEPVSIDPVSPDPEIVSSSRPCQNDVFTVASRSELSHTRRIVAGRRRLDDTKRR